MNNYIKVSTKLLIWARETAHLTFDDIPKSLMAPEKLKKIEEGEALLTFTQLKKLSHKYHRPLSTLLDTEIPEDDYAAIPLFRKENRTEYSAPLVSLIRDLQDKQEWARSYLIEEGYTQLDFINSVNTNDDVSKVAQLILKRFNLPSNSDYTYSQREDYLKEIRSSLEQNNVFVSITGSDKSNKAISLSQAQGFALSDPYAPFIFLNTNNTVNAKIFTLLHELVHLLLGETGISDEVIKFRKPECREDKIELFCNRVSAEILMPTTEFIASFEETNLPIEKKITKLSQEFLVSELAICLRLLHLKIIQYKQFDQLFKAIKEKVDAWMLAQKKKKKEASGGGDYYYSMLSRNGKLLSSLAFGAYKTGQVMPTDISQLLNVKTSNFNKYFEKI